LACNIAHRHALMFRRVGIREEVDVAFASMFNWETDLQYAGFEALVLLRFDGDVGIVPLLQSMMSIAILLGIYPCEQTLLNFGTS